MHLCLCLCLCIFSCHCCFQNRKRDVGSGNEFSDQSYESDEERQQSKAKKRFNDEVKRLFMLVFYSVST